MNILIFSILVTLALVAQASAADTPPTSEGISVNIKTPLYVDNCCYKRWYDTEPTTVSAIRYMNTEFLLKAKNLIKDLSDETYIFNLEYNAIFIDEPIKMNFIEESIREGNLQVDDALKAFRLYLENHKFYLQYNQLAVLLTCLSPSSDVKSVRMNDFYEDGSYITAVIVFDDGVYQNAVSLVEQIVEALTRGTVNLRKSCENEEIIQDGKITDCAKAEVKKQIKEAFQNGESLAIFSDVEEEDSKNIHSPPNHLSADRQCQMFYGPQFSVCEDGKDKFCEALKCCSEEMQHEIKAFDGTLCEQPRHCSKDQCIILR